jgi:ActR/RegA family two-component response regulator
MTVSGDGLKGKRVLVLEDDVLLAMDLEDSLNECGVEVIGPCSSVDAALGFIDNTLDAAVIDLNLRGKYSFPVIDKLRFYDIPFVICSGYAELPGMRDKLVDFPVLSKPCDVEKLARTLISLLPDAEDQASSGNRISQNRPSGL